MGNDKVRDVIRAVGRVRVARLCGVTPQAVSRWINQGKIPAEHMLDWSHATHMKPGESNPDFKGFVLEKGSGIDLRLDEGGG